MLYEDPTVQEINLEKWDGHQVISVGSLRDVFRSLTESGVDAYMTRDPDGPVVVTDPDGYETHLIGP